MPLNKSKGNMFPFCDYTFNMIKGKCFHDCLYCYMKDSRFKLQLPRLDESELKTDLGKEHVIFIGSSIDMWAENIPSEWIVGVLKFAAMFKNRYLFQTKNPGRFLDLETYLDPDAIYGTTIETNRSYPAMGLAPNTATRAMAMKRMHNLGHKTMVTIEPIMKFDTEMLVLYIKECNPEWVNLGADSKGHNLPEPSREEILHLKDRLQEEHIPVIGKKNLERLLNGI